MDVSGETSRYVRVMIGCGGGVGGGGGVGDDGGGDGGTVCGCMCAYARDCVRLCICMCCTYNSIFMCKLVRSGRGKISKVSSRLIQCNEFHLRLR